MFIFVSGNLNKVTRRKRNYGHKLCKYKWLATRFALRFPTFPVSSGGPEVQAVQKVVGALQANYFSLPWKIPEEIRRQSMLFHI